MSDVEPLFFAQAALYGCIHRSSSPATTGAVLIAPLFGELIQHHRAYYVLAEALADAGVPVIRYDHYGTGDSQGDLDDASVGRWVDDVASACQALVARTAVTRVHLIGARLGAAVAVAAAPRIGRAAGIVLWEPVRDGASHLAELLTTHRRVLGVYTDGNGDHGTREVLGFEIGPRLWDELERFDPSVARLSPMVDVSVFATRKTLAKWQAPDGYASWSCEEVQHPRGWLDPEEGMYDVLVPAAVVSGISKWIQARL